MPSDAGIHYKSFTEVFGTEMDENAIPSLKTGKGQSHGMPFNPVKQHATNTNIFVVCTECNNPHLVYAAKKI